MITFYANKGPYDINFLLGKLVFSEKKKIKKKKIKDISNLKNALQGEITFFDNLKYINDLKNTKASFCLIKKNYLTYLNKCTVPIISSNPLIDFIIIAKLFYPESDKDNLPFKRNIKYKNSFIDKNVKLGKKFYVGINTVIKRNVIIGNNVSIGSNCVISNCKIGDNTIINDGSVIGKIGYGFKFIKNKLTFIPHIGLVDIHENVYIGSNCTIDRGSFTNTIIGKNTMIDNQVHIAHNVKIGASCFIAGQVGIAGSSNIGNSCMIGGQSGISGHLNIGNNVHIGGNSGVIKNVEDNSRVMGYPSVEMKKFLKRNNYD